MKTPNIILMKIPRNHNEEKELLVSSISRAVTYFPQDCVHDFEINRTEEIVLYITYQK